MSRKPYFDKNGKKKGAWSKEEDDKLKAYIGRYGHWNWSEIPRFAGVSRCGKSCRLRWMNYLRPNMKHGNITKEEEDLIVELHDKIGNKWSAIAAKLPGRSDNEIKNYWNTNLRKRIKQDNNACDATSEPNQSEHLVENQDIEVPMECENLSTTSSSQSSAINSHGYPNVTQSSWSPSTLSSSSFTTSTITSTSRVESLSSLLNELDTSDSNVGSFWTDPLFTDFDITPMNKYSSDSDLHQATSCHDLIMDDEFLWSTMDLYYGYHSQLTK